MQWLYLSSENKTTFVLMHDSRGLFIYIKPYLVNLKGFRMLFFDCLTKEKPTVQIIDVERRAHMQNMYNASILSNKKPQLTRGYRQC